MPDEQPAPAKPGILDGLQAIGDSEADILTELRKGHALRCSLDPLVNDFKSPGTAEEIYAVLCKYHAQGLVDSNYENPDKAEDGVAFRWHLNFLGLQYLEKRGQEGMTPEEAYEKVTGRPIAAASQAQAVQQQLPAARTAKPAPAPTHHFDMATSKITPVTHEEIAKHIEATKPEEPEQPAK